MKFGKAKAITAIARKLTTLFYNVLRYGMKYVDQGANDQVFMDKYKVMLYAGASWCSVCNGAFIHYLTQF